MNGNTATVEVVEVVEDDETEAWIRLVYGPVVYEQETEDDK